MRSTIKRLFIVALLLIVAVFALSGVQAQSPRVVAIGDVHGDADVFVGILQAAGLIDAGKRWAGGNTRFVQTGDIFDRGAKVRDALDLLMQLEPQAQKAGGRVDALLGNHEVMNMLRDFRDVNPAVYAAFADQQSERRRQKAYDDYVKLMSTRRKKLGDVEGLQSKSKDEWMVAHPPGFVEHADAVGPKGSYGRWLRSHKVVLQVGDAIFMHAGIDPSIAPESLEAINARVAREIRAWDDGTDTATRAGLILPFFTLQETLDAIGLELQRIAAAIQAKEPLEDEVTREYVDRLQAVGAIGSSWLVTANGPLWFRGFATWTEQDLPLLEGLLQKYGAARFVTGHTVQTTFRITPRFDARIVLIDTGMLTSFKGRASALELSGGQMTAIYADGRAPVK